jgi:hypothetical protein
MPRVRCISEMEKETFYTLISKAKKVNEDSLGEFYVSLWCGRAQQKSLFFDHLKTIKADFIGF